MDIYFDSQIQDRLRRSHEIRVAVTDAARLVETARELLAATPRQCTHLVAFSPEGHAVAAAAATLALREGREFGVERASHVAPLHPGPARKRWRWMSVEQALGFGPVRPWVARWAADRGGGAPLSPSISRRLVEVA